MPLVPLALQELLIMADLKTGKFIILRLLPICKWTKEAYKKSSAPTINHFYEKLLLLKDKMNTETGKKLAEKRHRHMEIFLEEFFEEWDGKR